MLNLLIVLVILGLVLYFLRRHLSQTVQKILVQPRQAATSVFKRNKKQVSVDPATIADQALEVSGNQLRFDQVAQLLFDKKITHFNRQDAEQTQQFFLNKMPSQCLSQIEEFELGEWSIYWSYKQQSLEYYVGRYGVFYTHVDRFGVEHHQKRSF